MGRVIKLFIYYLLYTFAFTGIFSGGYMIANPHVGVSPIRCYGFPAHHVGASALHFGGRCSSAGLEICKA